MKKKYIILLIALVAVSCNAFAVPKNQVSRPMSIIALPNGQDHSLIKDYVQLKLPYGMIVSNGDTNSAPSYYLFCRDKRTILKTEDVDVFLAGLEALPKGATIDMVSKCTVGFYTQYGINIDNQYKKISSLLKQKQFKLISSMEDDELHTFFCCCETGFIILKKPRKSEQDESTVPPKAASSAPSTVPPKATPSAPSGVR